MSGQDTVSPLQGIKRTHENIMVITGISIGVILVVYFFTFAALVDSPRASLVWGQAISALLLVLALVFLKRLAFFLTRLLLGRRVRYRGALANLTLSELDEVRLD